MVKIHRIWFNTERMDREDHYKITLFSRPRVSIHVDEYIWSFIEENIVKPHKLMRSEKHGYLLDISFDQFDPAKHRYFPLSSYNGLLREGVEMDSANRSYFREDFAGGKDRTTWFSPNKIWTNCGDKVLNVDIKAANVSENITPREYADLLFDGIGAALVFNFKRLKREEFDGLKPKIDWSIVESFPFPAPFEEQRYIGDEGEIHVYSWDGRKETTLVGPYSVRRVVPGAFRRIVRRNFAVQSLVQRWILALERSSFWISRKKKICCKWNIRTAFCWIWAGIRTDTSFLSFIILIGRIQSSSMKRAETNQLPKLLTEAVRLVEKESQSAGAN